MNIKPTPEQVDNWELKAAQYADSQTDEYYEYQQAKNEKFAELAAQWGAEQERAKWLEANAPSGWIDDLRKQAQQTTEPELPEAVAWGVSATAKDGNNWMQSGIRLDRAAAECVCSNRRSRGTDRL